MNKKVNEYLENLGNWKEELEYLRDIVLECDLEEEFKWMHPCYTFKGKNILLLQEFKDYCALMFQKGVLLKDNKCILVQMTENTQSARQIRFEDLLEIKAIKETIKEYIFEAIEVEKLGLKVEFKKKSDYNIPDELKLKFENNPELKIAFEKLTEGRQKGYLLHFDKPKQSKSKTSRIEKNTQRILDGYGLNDCICGLSKRMPNCDGSHKQLK
jgi:uncharacterized protein YdeI (YjbR/CyaY-like superfamily)